jgi:hypothetical protein
MLVISVIGFASCQFPGNIVGLTSGWAEVVIEEIVGRTKRALANIYKLQHISIITYPVTLLIRVVSRVDLELWGKVKVGGCGCNQESIGRPSQIATYINYSEPSEFPHIGIHQIHTNPHNPPIQNPHKSTQLERSPPLSGKQSWQR